MQMANISLHRFLFVEYVHIYIYMNASIYLYLSVCFFSFLLFFSFFSVYLFKPNISNFLDRFHFKVGASFHFYLIRLCKDSPDIRAFTENGKVLGTQGIAASYAALIKAGYTEMAINVNEVLLPDRPIYLSVLFHCFFPFISIFLSISVFLPIFTCLHLSIDCMCLYSIATSHQIFISNC